ncbi:MAG: hypothetical protein QOH71_88 [Blastocatellia bacterium]|jgi:hypothetical protein|nr:hypothetical protein [Blastocatellia bacterium]
MMKQLTRVFLNLFGMALILVSTFPATSSAGNKDESKDVLVLEVSMTGLKPFKLPVIAQKKSGILPLVGAKVSAVKVSPWLEGNSVKLDVLAVLDPLPAERSCEGVKALKTELVASYTLGAGHSIQVSALGKFGVAPFSLKVMKVTLSPDDCPPTCCCCGPTMCCPRKGCLTCGDCGFCCNW